MTTTWQSINTLIYIYIYTLLISKAKSSIQINFPTNPTDIPNFFSPFCNIIVFNLSLSLSLSLSLCGDRQCCFLYRLQLTSHFDKGTSTTTKWLKMDLLRHKTTFLSSCESLLASSSSTSFRVRMSKFLFQGSNIYIYIYIYM